jgi:hypothetical protein
MATPAPNPLQQQQQQQQQQQRLITVSDDDSDDDDDSDSDDDDDSDSDDDDDDSDSHDDEHHSKSIDLSTIMSNEQLPSLHNFFESSGSNTEIKVIELKHCFNGSDDKIEYCLRNGDQNNSNGDSDSDDDDSDSDDGGSDDGDSDDSDGDHGNDSDDNAVDKSSSNHNVDNVDKKKHFEKINKEAHPLSDVPVPLKNMPVNMLRDLAKTKLTHLEQPTINKMSKKEILKALDN